MFGISGAREKGGDSSQSKLLVLMKWRSVVRETSIILAMDVALSTDVLEIFVKPDVAQQRYIGYIQLLFKEAMQWI